MFTPDFRVPVHPKLGDVHDLVVEELNAMARPQDLVIIEREQAEIALAAGILARDLSFGRLRAQIHPVSFDYWTRREGMGFWKDKANLRKFLADNPACAVESRSPHVRVWMDGRKGRWGSKTRGQSAADVCCAA